MNNFLDLDRYLALVAELKTMTDNLNQETVFIKDDNVIFSDYDERSTTDRLCEVIRHNYNENKFILARSRCYPFFEVKQ